MCIHMRVCLRITSQLSEHFSVKIQVEQKDLFMFSLLSFYFHALVDSITLNSMLQEIQATKSIYVCNQNYKCRNEVCKNSKYGKRQSDKVFGLVATNFAYKNISKECSIKICSRQKKILYSIIVCHIWNVSISSLVLSQ